MKQQQLESHLSGMPWCTLIACYSLSLKASYSRNLLIVWLLGWKGNEGKKPQTNMLPWVSVAFAGSSAAQSTSPGCAGANCTAVIPGLGCSQGRASSTHGSLWSSAYSQRAISILGCVLPSPKNLEPISLESLILLTPHNLQKWHSPKISQMLNV